MRNLRPSWVRSSTKSYDQTWLGRSARSRMHDPSFSHRRPRLGCLAGTFSPSRRQIRSTRLSLTSQLMARWMDLHRPVSCELFAEVAAELYRAMRLARPRFPETEN